MAPRKNARDAAPAAAATTTPATTTVPFDASPAKSTVSKGKAAPANWDQVLQNIYSYYMKETPQRTKLVDVFLGFLAVVGALQFVYCVVAGNFVSLPWSCTTWRRRWR